jgi:hypothetical protein
MPKIPSQDSSTPSRRLSIAERFAIKIDRSGRIPELRPDLGPCWLWRGTHYARGYGKFYHSPTKKHVLAHRASYELFVGEIPDGMEIDHLCRIVECVNPGHLEATTHSVNLTRAWRKGIPYELQDQICSRGHLLVESNIYRYRNSRSESITESCKECRRAQWREWNARRKSSRAQPFRD